MNQQDTEYVEITYNHRNRGEHAVYGGKTGTFYGYRAGGSRFLVHRDDVAAMPTLFTVVQTAPTAPKINYQTPRMSPPPPTPIVEDDPDPITIQTDLEDTIVVSDAREKLLRGNLDNIKHMLDLQALPGVTPQIAKRLAEAKLTSKDAILKAGIEGLTRVKGIADARASAIIEFLSD